MLLTGLLLQLPLAAAALANHIHHCQHMCCSEFVQGSFCMCLQLHFTDDAGEEPVELYHKLKLYGEDDPSGQASTKKPVSA